MTAVNYKYSYSLIYENTLVRSNTALLFPITIVLDAKFPKLIASSQTFLANSNLFITGGYKDNGDGFTLNRKTFIINVDDGRVDRLHDLPYGVFNATLAVFRRKVYLAGGLTNFDGEEVLSPLLVYDLDSNIWEEIQPRRNPDFRTNKRLKRLKSPGCCVANGRLYYIGGVYIHSNGKETANYDILELNLRNYTYKACKTSLDYTVAQPKCVTIGYNKILITGGSNPFEKGSISTSYMFSIDVSLDKIASPSIPITGSYPSKFEHPIAIIGSYPFVVTYNRRKKDWDMRAIGLDENIDSDNSF